MVVIRLPRLWFSGRGGLLSSACCAPCCPINCQAFDMTVGCVSPHLLSSGVQLRLGLRVFGSTPHLFLFPPPFHLYFLQFCRISYRSGYFKQSGCSRFHGVIHRRVLFVSSCVCDVELEHASSYLFITYFITKKKNRRPDFLFPNGQK